MSAILVGTVISGTLRPQDLIPEFFNELKRVDMDAYAQTIMNNYRVPAYVFDEGNDSEWWDSEDAMWMLESLIDALNDAAPEGYYFGAHEGDGADFGWWEIEEARS